MTPCVRPFHAATRLLARGCWVTASESFSAPPAARDYAEIRGASQEATAWRRLAHDLERLDPPSSVD